MTPVIGRNMQYADAASKRHRIKCNSCVFSLLCLSALIGQIAHALTAPSKTCIFGRHQPFASIIDWSQKHNNLQKFQRWSKKKKCSIAIFWRRAEQTDVDEKIAQNLLEIRRTSSTHEPNQWMQTLIRGQKKRQLIFNYKTFIVRSRYYKTLRHARPNTNNKPNWAIEDVRANGSWSSGESAQIAVVRLIWYEWINQIVWCDGRRSGVQTHSREKKKQNKINWRPDKVCMLPLMHALKNTESKSFVRAWKHERSIAGPTICVVSNDRSKFLFNLSHLSAMKTFVLFIYCSFFSFNNKNKIVVVVRLDTEILPGNADKTPIPNIYNHIRRDNNVLFVIELEICWLSKNHCSFEDICGPFCICSQIVLEIYVCAARTAETIIHAKNYLIWVGT